MTGRFSLKIPETDRSRLTGQIKSEATLNVTSLIIGFNRLISVCFKLTGHDPSSCR